MQVTPPLPPLRLPQAAQAMPLQQGLPLTRATDAARAADVAEQFEALIAVSLLRAARAADLGDDGLGASAGPLRDLIDTHRAQAIARAAPLGVAQLLAPK
jgi:Rod binding domain-containing protein